MARDILLYLVPALFILALFTHAANAQPAAVMAAPATSPLIVGSASLMAPAVLDNNTGALTNISVTVTKGTGYVTILGPSNVAADTNASALDAAMAAAHYMHLNYTNYNFIYTIADYNQSVSGPSAGATMTVLDISALSGKKLAPNFIMTGTIENGSIGPVGGVYDKSAAAAAAHMKFILVPAVQQGSAEAELYYLIQNRFGIKLIQVANISEAAGYAFGTVPMSTSAGSTFSFYTDYHAQLIPAANVSCSNSCESAPFSGLTNFTINMTAAQISSVSGFQNATAQMRSELNQSAAVASLGYLYAASDISFLNYINAYYFAHSNATIASGIRTAQNVSDYCSGINASALTKQNYEWVIAGDLRLAWGTYTADGAVAVYNSSGELTSDEVLATVYSAGQANAWCTAANYMFDSARSIGGTPVTVSGSLANAAKGRINRASAYGNSFYLQTAEAAYSNGNYPLAMLDADYAYALGRAGVSSANMSTGALLNASQAIAANSTYGIWATQFSAESRFYAHQAEITNSQAGARINASQAYSSALLAQQISNDTRTIYEALVPGQATTTVNQVGMALHFSAQQLAIYIILLIVIIILIIDFVILSMLSKITAGMSRRRR